MKLKNFLSGVSITEDGMTFVKISDGVPYFFFSAEPSGYNPGGRKDSDAFLVSGDIAIRDLILADGKLKISSLDFASLPCHGGYALLPTPHELRFETEKGNGTQFYGVGVRGVISDAEITAKRIDMAELKKIDDVYWSAFSEKHPGWFDRGKENLSSLAKKYVLKADDRFFFTKRKDGRFDVYVKLYEKKDALPLGYDPFRPEHMKLTLPLKITDFRYIILGPNEHYKRFDLGSVETHGGVGAVEYLGKFEFGQKKDGKLPFKDLSFDGYVEDAEAEVKRLKTSEYCEKERTYDTSLKN
ncbi:MAG: hypothetical protein LUD29_04970 [Clostridia bacterium]|nr:hypothetical protein [Clostridia bacterium]